MLLISYVFPPDATVGSRRWSKLAHFVVARGWGLDVITRLPPEDNAAGRAALDGLPAGVRVFGVPDAPLPFGRLERGAWRLYRRLRPHRGAPVAAPASGDAHPIHPMPTRPETVDRADIRWAPGSPRSYLRAFWVWREVLHLERWARRVAKQAPSIVEPGVHRVVVTSAPPHWTHDAGRRIAAALRVPFVMDMRDPWSLFEQLMERLASPLTFYFTRSREERGVNAASLVVANTEQARRALSAQYPYAASRIIAVMNGMDDDPVPRSAHGSKFIIVYAGTVYVHADLRNLFRAARRVITELSLAPDAFGIELIGEFDTPMGVPASAIARAEDIASYVSVTGFRPHAEVMQRLANAALLVTLPGFNALATIPAKVFECLRFDAWLLALADPGSATDLLLQGTEANVVRTSDVEGIAGVLRARVEAYVRCGVRPTRLATSGQFSRAHQAKILLDAIERVVGVGQGVHAS
jgi:glycosyltransferase involved in cell wall biosynthesis